MAETGMSAEEIERMQKRVDHYMDEVPQGHHEAAVSALLQKLKQAAAEMTMAVSASDLLDHAISYVEGKRRRL